jgi:hypothetical protein
MLLPSAPTITADGPTTFCEGDKVTLTSSEGNSYLWSSGETSQAYNFPKQEAIQLRLPMKVDA